MAAGMIGSPSQPGTKTEWVSYKIIKDGLEGWVNVNTDFSNAGHGGGILLGQQDNDIFGTTDLIGYSSSNNPTKIIRRY